MARASKFTEEQRLEIALEMLSGKMLVSEVCRKWDRVQSVRKTGYRRKT